MNVQKNFNSDFKGFEMPIVGKPTILYLKDGRFLKTSPVEKYFVSNGYSFLETANTIYFKKIKDRVSKPIKVAERVIGEDIIYIGQPIILKVNGIKVITSKVVSVKGNIIETQNTIYKIA